jgi:hypothetical protein
MTKSVLFLTILIRNNKTLMKHIYILKLHICSACTSQKLFKIHKRGTTYKVCMYYVPVLYNMHSTVALRNDSEVPRSALKKPNTFVHVLVLLWYPQSR